MQRPTTWKILTLGAAVTGLALATAGQAFAHSGQAVVQPISVAAAHGGVSTDWPIDDLLDDIDDVVRLPYLAPGGFVGFDDDWYDDDWYDD